MPSTRSSKNERVSEAALDYAGSLPTTPSGQHEYLSLLGLRSSDTAALLKRLDDHTTHAGQKEESRPNAA